MLASLRRAYPDARIDWLVQDSFVDAVRAHPGLTAAVPFPRHALGRSLRRGRIAELGAWIGALRVPAYDLAIDAQGLFRSGFLAWATGARCRVGHRAARELGWLFYTRRERGSERMHTVDRMLALVRDIGVEPVPDMRLYAPVEEREAAAAEPQLTDDFALFAPTSRWPGKQWPAERFAEVARRLLGEGLVGRVLVVGGGGERDQCAPLLALTSTDKRIIDLVGRTSIARLMALVERSAIVVANDSATLHMAVGFGRPLVALFGPTRVERVGPYGREADVLQHLEPGERLDHKNASAGRAMMARITVDEVLGACSARIAHRARDPAD